MPRSSRLLAESWLAARRSRPTGIGEIHEYALNSFYDLNFVKQLRRLVHFIREKQNRRRSHALLLYEHLGMTGAFLAGVRARVTSKGETDGFRTPMQKRAERAPFVCPTE